MKVKQKIKNRKDLFQGRDIVAVYLYGSFAKGESDEKSDLDIGVLFEDYEGLEQVVDLEEALEPCFDKEIDLRPLNVDDIVFKKEVVKTGELVFELKRDKRCKFEESVMRKYLDMKPYIQRYYNSRSERLEGLKS
ncbi:MAG: hypothetical protein BRC29_02110 [Nanohaloarchaea archaeon SW_7_43_1]|nr:MAG: hypothetical protein BRC29_02110 [Nanohaloarchaea archaeon SW_7_43_1]